MCLKSIDFFHHRRAIINFPLNIYYFCFSKSLIISHRHVVMTMSDYKKGKSFKM